MTWKEAFDVALPAWNSLLPCCQPKMCKIAGSIRRKKPEVKDIELVLVPQMVPVANLLGPDGETRSFEFVQAVEALGKVKKGSAVDGRYVQITRRVEHLGREITFDVFITTPEDFGRIFAIRTGSSRFSAKGLATRWSELGWCGTSEGLRRKVDCDGKVQKNGSIKWTPKKNLTPTLPPPFPSEEAFFEFLGIDWVEPERRGL